MNTFSEKIKQLKFKYFPPVSLRKATRIARETVGDGLPFYSIAGEKPGNISIYQIHSEPAWFILSPWNDGKDGTMLRSSRLIIVSKLSGRVLYDGSAEDEG